MKFVVISASLTFVYVTASSMLGAIFLLRKYGDKPDWMIFFACFLLGIIATVQNISAAYKMPPLKNGLNEALKQITKLTDSQHENQDQHRPD